MEGESGKWNGGNARAKAIPLFTFTFHFPSFHSASYLPRMVVSLLLILVAVSYRVVLGITGSTQMDWWHNFSPLAAIALCGAVYLPRRLAIAVPLVALFLSDLALNAHYHAPLFSLDIVPRYLALALCIGLGLLIRRQPALPRLLGASVAGSVLFYVITNTGSWLAEPAYAKTAAGWWQALTTGLPGFPPTITFFRNTLLSDLFFTGLFFACMSVSKVEAPATAKLREAA